MSSRLASPLRRVLIFADESAGWRVAGLTQLDRLALSLHEYVEAHGQRGPVEVCVAWKNGSRQPLPNDPRLGALDIHEDAAGFFAEGDPVDLVLSTRLFLHRGAIEPLLGHTAAVTAEVAGAETFRDHCEEKLQAIQDASLPWDYLSQGSETPECERRFLRANGKSQDGIISRHLNRRVSRLVSRWLLKLPLTPSTWSLLIFALPIVASLAFVSGTYAGFVLGAAIFQLYSILDGCDGEIARAKFMETEFGRRLDSLCDLIGNVMLALSLGIGLARQNAALRDNEWLYVAEGILTATLILTSEGIVFVRRSRPSQPAPSATRWNGVLYQRHHELVERSGILHLGEPVARWLVLLTKRDMAMLAFLGFALIGCAVWSLHLLLFVSAISSALAGNAFLRQPAPALPQEAS